MIVFQAVAAPTSLQIGKIGCLISKIQPFVFSPKAFSNALNVTNFNNDLFTYIAESNTMSANATLTATAILDDNTTATNYTAGCFAKDVTYNISMLNNPTTYALKWYRYC